MGRTICRSLSQAVATSGNVGLVDVSQGYPSDTFRVALVLISGPRSPGQGQPSFCKLAGTHVVLLLYQLMLD